MDAVLFPMAEGRENYPQVERLVSDGDTTALRIYGEELDDLFVLCEEDAGPVEAGDVKFEGRALLLRRDGKRASFGVNIRMLEVAGVREHLS